jgi:hypothetical protein
MLSGDETWRAWGELTPAVRTGETAFLRAHGMPVFECYGRHPAAGATFSAAMAEHTRDAAPGIVAAAGLGRFRTLVDVGGGNGTLVAEALRAHPALRGVVFDLPAALTSAPAALAAAGVADRARTQSGDAFWWAPAGADAYLLKQVLHDWEDDAATTILRRCREAMAPDGTILVVERALPEIVTEDDAQTLLIDVLMMAVTGGRERTEGGFRRLFEAAGLQLAAVGDAIPPFGYRVIEAVAA